MCFRDDYANIRNDLSGSLSKNRYRYELLWGIKKIYDLFISQEDFSVIFDYASDIDVVYDDGFEFYQLKTKNTNVTIGFIKRLSKSGESIISKLANLDTSNYIKSLNIVSNARFTCEDATLTASDNFSLNSLEDKEKEDIIDHVNQIVGKEIDLDKYHFIRSDICINKPGRVLLGETVLFLENVLDTNMMNPSYFLNYLQSLVMEKATYEKTVTTFDDILELKGVSKEELNDLLTQYKASFNPYMKEILNKATLLDGKIPVNDIIRVKSSIHSFRKLGFDSNVILAEILKVQNYIDSQSTGTTLDFFDFVMDIYNNITFDDRFDYYDKLSFILIGITNKESWGNDE